MTHNVETVLNALRDLRVNTVGGLKSPHKYLLLLALGTLYDKDPYRLNEFPLDGELESAFSDACRATYPDCDSGTFLIEFPYCHLSTDGIWNLYTKAGQESAFNDYETRRFGQRLTKSRIVETIKYGCLRYDFDKVFRDTPKRAAMLSEIRRILMDIPVPRSRNTELEGVNVAEALGDTSPSVASSGSGTSLARLSFSRTDGSHLNPFVAYLNSLQRLNASNDNALAESQACNPSFAYIHVSHPLSATILAELQKPDGGHVILSGHAGDGKSTIAVDVYKALAGIPVDTPLSVPMALREDMPGSPITIIKDLSERQSEADGALIQEMLHRTRRFLLVSNTGTLLDLLRGRAADFGISEIQLESTVLQAIGAEHGEETLTLGSMRVRVFNLARIDNLGLAREIFGRMVAPERWATCDGLVCRDKCPILLNVDLINRRRNIVCERIFLAYRRMYEYGTRLTLRQLTEHLAYLVTSGLEESDIAAMRERNASPLKAEFMFFNRFFGDSGRSDHPAALAMRAVQDIRKQGFGERPCPVWERRLWLKVRGDNFPLGVEECETEFNVLRILGASPGNNSKPGLTPDQARDQVRRMLYFLYDFPEGAQSYLVQFLGSPMILRWQDWQVRDARLDMTEKNTLEQRIYHVLQEHFTGVRLPEGSTGHDRRLYITLSRGKNEVRQSAQVVLAQVDWSNETALDLFCHQDASGSARTDLHLRGRGRIDGANLVLTLPFLDYVIMRHLGEVGEILHAAYVERLERFKAQVQSRAREDRSDIMLVRLRTDHTFRRQQYTVHNGRLEVTDVL